MALTDEQLLGIVNDEFSNALGADGGEIASERARAFRFYLSEPLGNEVEGESQVVSSDVADVVDGIMPSLLRLFTMADNLIAFDPVSQEDIERAEQESDYVNYVFFKQNPAFLILFSWFFDALVQKNGVVKAWWDDSEVVTTETYQGLSDAELVDLMNDDELEPIERSERVAETVVEDQVIPATVHDIKFRRVSQDGRARVDNVPPEEYRISADARSLDPSTARMVGQEREVTRSELLEMGFDPEIVDDLPAEGDFQRTDEAIARRSKSDETYDAPQDRSQDKIKVREAYIKLDFDEDGRSELRQIFTAGNTVLSNEEVDRQPFHVICPHPLPHKHFGRSSAEKVMDVQEVSTTLERQILMNLYHTNSPGKIVWEQAMTESTLDDLLTRRVGRVAMVSRPVREAVMDESVPFTAGSTFPMLEFFDKVKRDRTGVNADSEGLSPEALKNIQTTVLAQATDLSKMKIEAIARIFAETGIKSLFLHLHELLMKHQQKAQIVRLRNQFVPVDPQQWRTRMDMTVQIGLGIGTREQNLVHLQAIKDLQAQMIEAGGMNLTVSPKNVYNTAAEFVKNANLKDPSMFFTDPGNQQGPPPNQEQIKLQQQQQQLQQRQQQLDAQRAQNDQAKLQLQAREQQLKHERERLEIERKREKDRDDLFVALEEIRNALTKMELDSNTDVPGSRV